MTKAKTKKRVTKQTTAPAPAAHPAPVSLAFALKRLATMLERIAAELRYLADTLR
jgi:hypothetical protein